MIIDIINMMKALEYIQGSSLTADEKRSVAIELQRSLPAKVLCHSAQNTHDIATALFEKAIVANTARTDVAAEEEDRRAEDPPEARQEGHKQPSGSAPEDGVPRDDQKAPRGSRKVESAKPASSWKTKRSS